MPASNDRVGGNTRGAAGGEDLEALVATALSVAAAALQSGARPAPLREDAPPKRNGPALMSIPDAAAELGLSRASAYRYANEGRLPVKRFGRRVYVVRELLNEFMRSTTVDSSEADAA